MIAIGSAVAIGCALVVGVFSGITGVQSAWAAILLGWLVGLAIRRSRCESPAAFAGASIALAGSAGQTMPGGEITSLETKKSTGAGGWLGRQGLLVTAANGVRLRRRPFPGRGPVPGI